MREQTLSQPQLSTDSSGPAAQEPGASAEESGASAATTGSTADAKIPFRPRKIRKVSSEGDPQQVSSPASTKKAANSRAPLLRVVSRPLSADGEIDNALHHLRAADHLLARVIDAHDPPDSPVPPSPVAVGDSRGFLPGRSHRHRLPAVPIHPIGPPSSRHRQISLSWPTVVDIPPPIDSPVRRSAAISAPTPVPSTFVLPSTTVHPPEPPVDRLPRSFHSR